MKYLRLYLAIVLLSHASLSGAREIEHRIVLKPGRIITTVTGRIPSPDDSVVYEFNAQAGQKVLIRLKPGGKLVAQAVLVLPSGTQEGPGAELTYVVHETGILRVRIIPREQSFGSFQLSLSVR